MEVGRDQTTGLIYVCQVNRAYSDEEEFGISSENRAANSNTRVGLYLRDQYVEDRRFNCQGQIFRLRKTENQHDDVEF
jgi:hypothetical protein